MSSLGRKRGGPTPREGARSLLQPLQTVLVAWLFLCAARSSAAFPVFFTANGSAVVTSAFGADVVLRPDGSGAVTVGGPLRAQAGLTIGATSLSEAALQRSTVRPPCNGAQPSGKRFAHSVRVFSCM